MNMRMNVATLLLSLLALGSAGAQTSMPSEYLRADSTGLDVRVIGLQMSAKRSFLANSLTSTAPRFRGVEAMVRGGSAGAQVRYSEATTPDGPLRDVDARLLLGDRKAYLEIGYVQRTLPERSDTTTGLVRVGLLLLYEVGGSGASVQVGAGGVVNPRANPLQSASGQRRLRANDLGWDAEASFHYALDRWRIPLEVMVGYRGSVLRLANREEEMGQVLLGAGLRLSGR